MNLCFTNLSEEEESVILKEIYNFIGWVNKEPKYYEDFCTRNGYIKKINNNYNVDALLEFWYSKVGKSETIEKYLEDITVIADLREYIEKNLKKITLLMPENEKAVISKNNYRSSEQALIIKSIYKNQYANLYQIKKIKDYIESKKGDWNHIDINTSNKVISILKKYNINLI